MREGKRLRTTHLEVRAIASPLASPSGTRTRIGLIVPRFHQSAVSRNRLKRRLRELSRTRLIPSDLAADVVIRIRPDAYRADFAALAQDIDRALGQLARWRETAIEPVDDTPELHSGPERTGDT